jgi:hypothetical protein
MEADGGVALHTALSNHKGTQTTGQLHRQNTHAKSEHMQADTHGIVIDGLFHKGGGLTGSKPIVGTMGGLLAATV